MTPVRSPAVTASVRPWPSCASKVFISSAEPSDCDSNMTLPSVSVPSTSISSTRICFARLASFPGIFLPRLATAISSSLANGPVPICRTFFERRVGCRAGAQHAAPLHELQGPQIMQMHYAEHARRFIRNHDRRNLPLLHQIQCFAREHVRPDRLRALCHALARGHLQRGPAMLLHQPPQVAVR